MDLYERFPCLAGQKENIEKEAILLLIMERLNLKRHELILNLDNEINNNLNNDILRLKSYEPVQYILGYTYFYKSKFIVNKDTTRLNEYFIAFFGGGLWQKHLKLWWNYKAI